MEYGSSSPFMLALQLPNSRRLWPTGIRWASRGAAVLAGLALLGCGNTDQEASTSGSWGGSENQGSTVSTGTGRQSSSSSSRATTTSSAVGKGGQAGSSGGASSGKGGSTSDSSGQEGGSTGGAASSQEGGSTTGTASAGGAEGHGGKANVGGSNSGTASGGKANVGGSNSGTASGGKANVGGSTSGTASGGKANVGGSTSGTASGGTASGGSVATHVQEICEFASGVNIAWVNFAKDVPDPDIAAFEKIFKKTYDAGGRIVRWWFHTNGTLTPGYDSSGLAKPIEQSHIDGVKSILSAANSAGVGVVISLWSFDMLQSNAGDAVKNNKALLENDKNRQAYVDNYLTPLATAIKGTPGLYSWEIFNEPEGMSPRGWSTTRTTQEAIQKMVNWCSAAIHTADPLALVTNGAQTFDYCSKVSGKTNYYSDDALRTIGGKQNGTLNFYEVHYYTSNGVSNSPFAHPASYWGLDKKIVMGEFYPSASDNVAANELYKYLYDKGYAGAWAWSTTDASWSAIQAPMQALAEAQPVVKDCP